MKTRFLAFLGALAVGSAAVLVYASHSRQHESNASLNSAEDCSACEMSAAKPTPPVAASLSSSSACCADETARPTVATLDTAGCPYVAGDTAIAAKVADVQPAKTAGSACCAEEAAAPAVAAQVEK
jgi:hypothetical protein